MSKSLKLTVALAALAVASVGVGVAPAGAGATGVFVTGEAVCDLPTGNGTYQLNWMVENFQDFEIVVDSAVESGAWVGNVTLTPNPIPSTDTATGSDGPVPGDTVGVVTLTVQWSVVGGPSGQAVGQIELDGTCVPPTTTTTAPSTTTTAAAPQTLTPAFTG